MVSSETLKEIMVENREYILSIDKILPREIDIPDVESLKRLKKAVVLYGVRRSGKSFILLHIFKKHPEKAFYIDFADERLHDIEAKDLEKIWETILELKPELIKSKDVILLFDEIQNVPMWEKFVRRLVEKKNAVAFCAGSSSKITPKEIHTSLRGRSWSIEVLPFSFKEFMNAKFNVEDVSEYLYGDRKVLVKGAFLEYVKYGGMPEVVLSRSEFEKRKMIKEYISSMYFRDMVERYRISNIVLLDTLWNRLFTAYATKFSVNGFYRHYRNLIPISKDTLYEYYKHFIDSMLLFEVRKFTESPYKRMRNPAKIYLVDHGLAKKISSENFGRILENIIYIELRRRGYEVYYLEEEGRECDFIAMKDDKVEAYQVSWELNEENKDREIEGLLTASRIADTDELFVLTYDQEGMIKNGGKEIKVIPAWKWLLRTTQGDR
ncbi:MAG: hypothetical protein DRP30_06290 [Thermotoga sp.]|nr:MAG: hypothetical protein DRP30_06290 [Thermotoga sp.]